MKRIVAGFAWAFALIWASNYVAPFAGASLVPAMLASAVGVLVATDPLHRIWPRSITRAAAIRAPEAAVEGMARP